MRMGTAMVPGFYLMNNRASSPGCTWADPGWGRPFAQAEADRPMLCRSGLRRTLCGVPFFSGLASPPLALSKRVPTRDRGGASQNFGLRPSLHRSTPNPPDQP